MSGTGRGRSRGRRKSDDMPQQPDQAAMDKIKQEKASLAIKDPPTPEQTASTFESDSAKTTTGEGKTPPLVAELKETVQGGIQLSSVNYGSSITTTISFNKLNPSAPIFTPSPPTTTSTVSHPIYTKHSIPATANSSASSKLDPDSKEFVPAVFTPAADLPTSYNGDPSLYGNGDVLTEEEELDDYLDITTVVRGFEKAAPTDPKDSSSEPVLRAAAEMLLKVSYYPGSFDELGKNFQSTLSKWVPSENTLINLAEMLVHWGVNVSDLRYAACRVSYLISEMKEAETFRTHLLKRLQSWHRKCYGKEPFTSEADRYNFANYSGFCAEVFSKFTAGGQPINAIMPFIFKYVDKLLNLKEEYYVREACKILKLTGSNLVGSEQYLEEMTKIIKMLESMTMDSNLSRYMAKIMETGGLKNPLSLSTCISLIMQVLELGGAKWSSAASPINPLPVEAKKATQGLNTQGLNTNAAPFVPSDSFIPETETFYNMPVTQQPVTCAADWDDFVGEDQLVEGYDDNVVENEDDYDGLDPEIELEMEAFIDEIEEHLMLQDFDPELHQND